MKTTKLKLEAFGDVTIEGCGEALAFKFTATRKNKVGGFEKYELDIRTCRYVVRRLAQQIAGMQERDRRRIAEQTDRLTRELAPLAPLVKP